MGLPENPVTPITDWIGLSPLRSGFDSRIIHPRTPITDNHGRSSYVQTGRQSESPCQARNLVASCVLRASGFVLKRSVCERAASGVSGEPAVFCRRQGTSSLWNGCIRSPDRPHPPSLPKAAQRGNSPRRFKAIQCYILATSSRSMICGLESSRIRTTIIAMLLKP